MSYVVVDQQGNEVATFPPDQWREACSKAHECEGWHIKTVGTFDGGRKS